MNKLTVIGTVAFFFSTLFKFYIDFKFYLKTRYKDIAKLFKYNNGYPN